MPPVLYSLKSDSVLIALAYYVVVKAFGGAVISYKRLTPPADHPSQTHLIRCTTDTRARKEFVLRVLPLQPRRDIVTSGSVRQEISTTLYMTTCSNTRRPMCSDHTLRSLGGPVNQPAGCTGGLFEGHIATNLPLQDMGTMTSRVYA